VRTAAVLAGVVVTVALAPSVARAFPVGEQFDADPLNGASYNMPGDCDRPPADPTNPPECEGGGGIVFDGAPRFAGHTCAVCHVDAPGRIGLRLEADDPSIFTDGYQPSKTYKMRVILQDEWAGVEYRANGDQCGFNSDPSGPYAPCDPNGFAMEIDDTIGRPLGAFEPVANGGCTPGEQYGDDVFVPVDAATVAMKGGTSGQVTWDLCWKAPEAGYGALTVYLAGVDGGGGDGTADFPEDPYGDDVAAGSVPLLEAGAPPPVSQTGGCSATGGGGGGLALALGALFGLGLGRRRRRRRRRGVAGLLAVATLALAAGGCVHVRPSQRETLAERKMKFAPDPTEDELDLHMQEAREGSSGGYGSAGGGCGCN
jgi:uncharacterized protein (TIGR03382 family)